MTSAAFLQSSNSVILPTKEAITRASQYVLFAENILAITQLSSKRNYTKLRLGASKHATRYGGDFVEVLMSAENCRMLFGITSITLTGKIPSNPPCSSWI